MKLRSFLGLTSLLFCLIPAAVITFYSYNFSIKAARESAASALTITSSRAMQALKIVLIDVSDTLNSFTENPAFVLLPPHEQSETLLKLQKKYPVFTRIYYTNSEQSIIASSDRSIIGVKVHDLHKLPEENLLIQNPITLEIPLAHSLSGNEEYLYASLNLANLKKNIYRYEQPAPRGSTFPFLIDFEVIAPVVIRLNDLIGQDEDWNNLWSPLNPGFKTWYYTDNVGDEYIAARTPLLGHDVSVWNLVLTSPTTLEDSPFRTLLKKNLIVIGVSLIMAFGLIRILNDMTRLPGRILLENFRRRKKGIPLLPMPSFSSGTTLELSEALEELDRDLHDAQEEALTLAGKKREFLALMSQQIRHPLNNILTLSELVCDNCKDKELTAQLSHLRESGMDLRALVQDMFTYHEIENGRYELANMPFNIFHLLSKLEKKLTKEFPAVEINLSLPEYLPQIFSGDPVRLHRILQGLLSDLLEGSQTSALEIAADFSAQTGHKRPVFSVSLTVDHPLDSDGATEIRPYYESTALSARTNSHQGLKLAVVLGLIHIMKGSLYIETSGGYVIGYHFTLELLPLEDSVKVPAASSASDFNSVLTEATRELQIPALNILLVDDNPTSLRLVKELLERLGHSVTTATNGQQALLIYNNQPLDIIFLDCQMPVLDGYQTAKAIREIEEDSDAHVLIVALTGLAMEGDRQKCLDSGMDDFIAKPLAKDDLVRTLSHMYRDHLEHKKPGEPKEKTEAS